MVMLILLPAAVVTTGENSCTVPLPALATYRLPTASKARVCGLEIPAEYVALAVVLPAANLSTVLLARFETYRLPPTSIDRASGPDTPAV